jgi:predicted small lipoprotein YifL
MKKVLAALVLGAALVTTVVGCGGGSPTGTKSTK